MQLPTVPATLITLAGIVFACLANWLKSDGLPQRTNIIIAVVAVIVVAVAGILLTSGFTGNFQQDALLIAACVIAFWQQLNSLLTQAQKSPSPLLPAGVAQAMSATPKAQGGQ